MANPPDCDECGDLVDSKNSAGHYRAKCWNCITDTAHIIGDEPKRERPRPQDRI